MTGRMAVLMTIAAKEHNRGQKKSFNLPISVHPKEPVPTDCALAGNPGKRALDAWSE
jgi:hypothetical protein